MTIGKPVSDKIKDFAVERYDHLVSEYNETKCSSQIAKEIRDKFGLRVSPYTVLHVISERLPGGTHLHEFFDIMVSDFKSKHGHTINERSPSHLLNRVTYFIEKEYGFGGKLKMYQRCILSNVLDKREDIVFVDGSSRSYSGRCTGKLGYFR